MFKLACTVWADCHLLYVLQLPALLRGVSMIDKLSALGGDDVADLVVICIIRAIILGVVQLPNFDILQHAFGVGIADIDDLACRFFPITV